MKYLYSSTRNIVGRPRLELGFLPYESNVVNRWTISPMITDITIVELIGLEPTTSILSGWHSNQLKYSSILLLSNTAIQYYNMYIL